MDFRPKESRLDRSQRSLRVLVIGCGSIGQRHIKNLLALGVGEILAFDVLEDSRKAVEATGGVGIVASLEAAWDWEPEVVLIASPTPSHIPLALHSAKRGCAFFIEKPLSHSHEGLSGLCKEVERRRLVTMVACNMRFHPGPATVKRLLEEQSIGQIIAARIQTGSYLPRWRPWQDYRQSYSASVEWGGAILDCIHEIDLALWYFGPGSVLAAAHLPAQNLGLQTDGLAEMILCHDSGMLSSVHLNFLQRDYRRTCQIIGEEGTIYWDFSDHQVRVHGENGDIKEIFPEPEGWQINQMYLDELEHFLLAVRSGSQTVNPISGGIAALEVALAARQMGLETRT